MTSPIKCFSNVNKSFMTNNQNFGEIKVHPPCCWVMLALPFKLFNLTKISSVIFCFKGPGNWTTSSPLEISSLITFAFWPHKNLSFNFQSKNTNEAMAQNTLIHKWLHLCEKMDLTNLTSSKGSDALRIRIDSSIFLIWSGVYLTTENFYFKKKLSFY